MLCLSQRYFTITALVLIAFLLAFWHDKSHAVDSTRSSASTALRTSSTSIAGTDKKSATTNMLRLREGAQLVNDSGHFRVDGDGATFVSDKGYEFGGLPNLNLQRVVRVLKNAEDSHNVRWMVSGTVTEFADRNFLLISRAVYKSAAVPPLPEQLK